MTDDYYIEVNEGSSSLKLPSETKKKKKRKSYKSIKWSGIILVLTLIYLFYEPILGLFFDLLSKNPTIYSYYLFVEGHMSNLTLIGLYFFSIFSTLFFLILPSEATFIYFLDSTNYLFLFVFLFALLGNLTGMAFNYFFGRILGEKVLKWMFKEKDFFKYKDIIDKWGGYLLFFGNIFPGPIEFVAVFYGGFKFPFAKYLYFVFLGRLIKYIILFTAFTFWWDPITFFYNSIVTDLGEIFTF